MPSQPERRPVYVLGAGFSKAISDAMPVTDELGTAIFERLSPELDQGLRPGESFEQWLTLQATPLPFLAGFENSRRASDAVRAIAAIATILDAKVAAAGSSETPLWLRQMIAIWHAERAVILTFNYDTLVEMAINSEAPTLTSADGSVSYILGDQVVFPAPPAPPAQFVGDMGADHVSDSMEILKMHGSLNWFWASGDSVGSTLIRLREKHVLGSPEPVAVEVDFVGASSLDRYLIPPVTSKDSYYETYLANTLWRKAGLHMKSASNLTLLGYSLPREDRIATQLIAQVPRDLKAVVVDRTPGSIDDPNSILGNLSRLGIEAQEPWGGRRPVEDYVQGRIRSATEDLSNSQDLRRTATDTSSVVVAISDGWGSSLDGQLYVLASGATGTFEALAVPRDAMRGSSPLHEYVSNLQPRGGKTVKEFLTVARLRVLTTDRQPFMFTHPRSHITMVAIGTRLRTVGTWEVMELEFAPYE